MSAVATKAEHEPAATNEVVVHVDHTGWPRDDAGRACVSNYIDGVAVTLPSSSSFPVVSARTGEVVHYGQSATEEVTQQAADSAWRAFQQYRKTSVPERRRLLERAATLFEARAEDLAHRQILETSCNAPWAQFTAMQTSMFCREVANSVAAAVQGEIPPSAFGFTSLVFKEPVGPALLIPPWNAAVVLSVRGIANALAAGCTVILKASEMCPWTHQAIAETFLEAGFPRGAVNMVMGARSEASRITEALISHRAIRKIEFIGSMGVGRSVGAIAARHLKPVILELGDQSPAIILDDADLPRAAELCARGALLHSGQTCFSTERILVHHSVFDRFAALLGVAFEEQAPRLSGFAISKAAADRSRDAIDDAVHKGARILYGSRMRSDDARIAPAILTDVSDDSALSTGEAFAPVVFLDPFATDQEAIDAANAKLGGLSAAVFTANYERGLEIARDLEFGMVNINNLTVFAEPTGPAGGIKGSGWGSNNGQYGIHEYLVNKMVSLVPTAKTSFGNRSK